MPRSLLIAVAAIFFFSCKTTTYYVVRHAERDNTVATADVPLSEAGKQHAEALKEQLKGKRIGTIYSTNYARTRATAQPLADALGVTVQIYDPRDSTFISRIVNTGNKDEEGNILIVGHSNTVDDIVNNLVGLRIVTGDLPDTQYGDLYIVRQRGKKFTMKHSHF